MKKKFLYLFLIPTLLTGCTGSLKLEYVPFNSYIEEADLFRDYEDEHFKASKDITPISTLKGDYSSINDLLENNRTGKKLENMASKGDRKLLVIPICFKDSDMASLTKKTIYIQNAFFGETNHTTYDSVTGYYNKSSYGQLRITGEVAPWYQLDINAKDWKSKSGSKSNASSIIVEEAVDYIKENNLMDLSIYDTDNDDNIDGIYAIYDHPFSKKEDDDIFWAYTYYTYQGNNGLNNEAPYANNYSWTSVNALMANENKSYTNYLIHETGHLLGLSDYYNTDFSVTGNYHYQPTGCFDMMDYNIGDHSAFSKYLLNWTSPLVIKDNTSFDFKMKPLQSSGEYILVPSAHYKNNPSPFSEYLLIEYFTPEGLNKHNGTYSYDTKDGSKGIYRYPQFYGLKIYHVNAKLAYFKKTTSKIDPLCLVDDPDAITKTSGQDFIVDYAYDNSINDSKARNGYPVLYHLLESSGENTFMDGLPASNNTLFIYGDDFGINHFKDFTFSDGSKADFTLKVISLSSKEITLRITKE